MSDLKEKWKSIAESELKTDQVESLDWDTLEGIKVKPVYTSNDLMELEHLEVIS